MKSKLVVLISHGGASLNSTSALYRNPEHQKLVAIFSAGSDRRFFYKVVNAELEFEVDSQGAVTQVTLHQNGRDHIAKRLSETK